MSSNNIIFCLFTATLIASAAPIFAQGAGGASSGVCLQRRDQRKWRYGRNRWNSVEWHRRNSGHKPEGRNARTSEYCEDSS